MSQDKTNDAAAGYTVKAVCARIADMDVAAAGNAERAAWKRYMGYALLAIARGVDKKALVEAIFGKGAKASKTFQNMYSMADKARNTVLGNHSWDDVRALPIDQATTMVIGMINRHMAMLSCSSKNEYDRFCNLSLNEADTKRRAEADAGSEPDAPALLSSPQPAKTLAAVITPLLEKSPFDERMAAMSLIASSVDEEARRIFAEGLLAELHNEKVRQTAAADPWLAVA